LRSHLVINGVGADSSWAREVVRYTLETKAQSGLSRPPRSRRRVDRFLVRLDVGYSVLQRELDMSRLRPGTYVVRIRVGTVFEREAVAGVR
jgi:hypothetical protein